jgi:hypothetical protein
MKQFLLTWYGITDLRAALGFEENGGPILAALMAREYTHILILAYTDPAKTGSDVQLAQEKYVAVTAPALAVSGAPRPPRADQTEAVDAFSNTPEGYKLFGDWLYGEIKKRELGVAIRMVPKELATLNDSKGIYDAAAEALDVVVAVNGEKELSLYLSPGTPVMAFTWAFVSLMNPELKLRVIVAPDHRRPPVEVRLPYEILDPSSRKRRRADPVRDGGFDTVFHLFGEQRLPSLLGVLQFPSKRHVFVTSPKYPADSMEQFLPEGASFSEVHVNPFDPMSTHSEILKAVASMPEGERVGFNLTGGTKLMFAGAQAACRKIGGVPFYFEARDQSLIFLDDFSTMEARGVENIERFVELGGFSVSRRGLWTDNPARERRRELTKVLWHERRLVADLYRDLAAVNRCPLGPFQIERSNVAASLDDQLRGKLRLRRNVHVVEQCPDFAAYLCGGWLEEYVFMRLEPLFREGKLRDLRIGLEVSWKTKATDTEQFAAQEFDVALTDGRRLFILECKAGRVLNEDIYKLENVVRNHGGVEARGMLIAAFPPTDAAMRRLQSAKNLGCLVGDQVSSRLAEGVLMALNGAKI